MKRILSYFMHYYHHIFKKSGWFGSYSDWDKAAYEAKGYDEESIFRKVFEANIKVHKSAALYERDGLIFNQGDYSWELLTSLFLSSINNHNQLNVIDFGGSLGSTYIQHKPMIKYFDKISWNVIEQTHFVDAGIEHFTTDNLHFYHSLDQCLASNKCNIILLCSVLQYIDKPYTLLNEIIKTRVPFIYIERTLFNSDLTVTEDLITVKKVPKSIYKASYPCYLLSLKKFSDYMSDDYELISEFNGVNLHDIRVSSKGFLFKLKHDER